MASVWPSISRALGQRLQLRRQQRQQLLSVRAQRRAAALVEGAVPVLQQLHAQPLAGHRYLDLLGKFLQFLLRLDLLLQLVFQLLHGIAGRRGHGAGSAHRGAQQLAGAHGIVEVAGHGLFHLVAGTHQPQHDKQRHHGGNKVGVGHLPCAAVVAGVAAVPLDHDDGLHLCRHDALVPLSRAGPYAATAFAMPPWSLQRFSISSKLGRTWAGIALRPISMAIIGAAPFRNESISTRSMCR